MSRVQAWARIPESEHTALEETIRSNHDDMRPHEAQFVESAMENFIDDSMLAGVPSKLTAIDQTLTGLLGGYLEKTKSEITSTPPEWDDEPTTELTVRINADLKDRFQAWVNEHTDLGYGEAMARALREQRQNSHEQRINDLASHIHDQLTTLEDDTRTDQDQDQDQDQNSEQDYNHDKDKNKDQDTSTDSMYSVSDKKAQLRSEIVDKFGEDFEMIDQSFLIDQINTHCTTAEEATDPTHRKYLDWVMDEFNLVENPDNDALFIAESKAPDGPAADHKAFGDLSQDEAVEGIQVILARSAQSSTNGKASVTSTVVREQYYDNDPSPGHTTQLIRRAAEGPGFTIKKRNGELVLRVDLDGVAPGVLETVANSTGSEGGDESVEDQASADMDALVNAQIATDGGTEM